MISRQRAHEIACGWYGGQWTGLYTVACNSDIDKMDLERAADETHEEWSIQKSAGDNNAARTLGALENWLRVQLKKRQSKMSLAQIANDGLRHASGFYPIEAPK